MKPLLTVIIPVHNAEKYLCQCIESVLVQTLSNIEVVAVDDGSTDDSGKILYMYALKDTRLKVIHMENLGVAEARNEGMKHIRGEYVTFVDSDDWIDTDMYEEMLKIAKKQDIDIVMCGYIREFENHSKIKNMGLEDGLIMYKEEISKYFMRQMVGPIKGEPYITENLDMHSVVWNKIYKTEIVKNIEFCSLKEIGSCEDLLFNLTTFSKANSIAYINKSFYHYRKVLISSVSNAYRPNLLEKRMNLIEKIRKVIDTNISQETYYEALNNRICLGIMGMGLNIVSSGNRMGIFTKLRQVNELLSNEDIVKAFQQFDTTSLDIHWKLFYYFAKARNGICYLIMLRAIKFMIKFSP
ncbi:glycosyltransferase [Clostridium thermarum]|uniref:glycosyltransferase n=1 Tax=Clostridium thermarum TaxID=1716543 RepID=UPI0011232134|nr:glycosyltransferase [Clostridium thermarum]